MTLLEMRSDLAAAISCTRDCCQSWCSSSQMLSIKSKGPEPAFCKAAAASGTVLNVSTPYANSVSIYRPSRTGGISGACAQVEIRRVAFHERFHRVIDPAITLTSNTQPKY